MYTAGKHEASVFFSSTQGLGYASPVKLAKGTIYVKGYASMPRHVQCRVSWVEDCLWCRRLAFTGDWCNKCRAIGHGPSHLSAAQAQHGPRQLLHLAASFARFSSHLRRLRPPSSSPGSWCRWTAVVSSTWAARSLVGPGAGSPWHPRDAPPGAADTFSGLPGDRLRSSSDCKYHCLRAHLREPPYVLQPPHSLSCCRISHGD